MKVLHVGNIANNGYNNAKFLRRKGVEAYVLCYDYTHIMGQPEWEDGEFDEELDEFTPQWEGVDLGSFRCPDWFIRDRSSQSILFRKQRFRGQLRLERMLFTTPRMWACAWAKYLEARVSGSMPRPTLLDILQIYPRRKWFEHWFEGYDLIQAYGTDPIHAWLFGDSRPYVAFEHGTMREYPFEDSAIGRLLSLAYRKAGRIIITNPDVISAARRLGLTNFQFIPHPVDETKYRPQPSKLWEALRDQHQADLILFAPSRQNWTYKGNDRVFRAFARLRKATSAKSILIVCTWGQEVDRSRQLIQELGIGDSVVWVPPLNKAKLIEHYNAADIVVDQFIVGTFGAVAPEAMACGKPVVMYFDRSVHDWCYADMPPVCSAQTEDEIFVSLTDLVDDPSLRASVGQRSREWIVKHHGWELVADRQISIYRELLQR